MFGLKKGKRKFPYANDLKYWDDFNITQLGRGRFQTHHDKNSERCSDIRPLGLYIQTKIRTKMNDNIVHIITSRIISYCNINANLNDNIGSDRSKHVFLKSLHLSFIFLQALRGFLGYRCAFASENFMRKVQTRILI